METDARKESENKPYLIVYFIGFLLTVLVAYLVTSNSTSKALIAFEEQVTPLVLSVEEAIQRDVEAVLAISSFYDASNHVDRLEFKTFVRGSLDRFPSIQVLEWIPRVSIDQRASYEAEARRDNLSDYTIKEKQNGKMVPAGEREEYFPVFYVEPLESNKNALGFDLASNSERMQALNKARDSGNPVASGRVRLAQDTKDQFGVLFLVPIYDINLPANSVSERRDALIGFALGVYRMGDLVENALVSNSIETKKLRLLLVDLSAENNEQLLYPAKSEKNIDTLMRGVNYSHKFEIGGREWMSLVVPTQSFPAFYQLPEVWFSVIVGLLLTFFIAGYFRNLIHRNAQIEQQVKEQTAILKYNEAFNSALYETVVDGIITITPLGIIQSCNPATSRMFDYQVEELLGQNINMLMPEKYAEAHDGYLHQYMETGDARIIGIGREVEGMRKDGSVFPLELAVSRMEVEGEIYFTGVVRDIAERKRVEKLKSEFISTVSHELRTPLTSIRGAMGLVASGAAGELPEQAKKLVKIAASNSERLVRLINDILDIEKIEAGRMQFSRKKQSLFPVVEKAIEENKAYAAEHGSIYLLKFSEVDVSVDIDADRIRQVLDNLLSNAAKYGADEDEIEVEITVDTKDVQVQVRDHGKGIPEEFQGQIFAKFAQADSSDTRTKGGTGLGLSIAKAITEQHGGSLSFESVSGSGTSFIMSLPIAILESENNVAIDLESRVLICEDDKDVGTLLSLLLEKSGIKSDLVLDANQALEALEKHDYQAMTLDLMLPERDGISLLSELRESERFSDLPVVVISAKGEKDLEVCSALRVSDWLGKPIDESRLIDSVKSAMRRQHDDSPALVLHVEDDPDIATVVEGMLHNIAQIEVADSLASAKSRLNRKNYDLVILDIGLPDGSGLDLLPVIATIEPVTPVVIFSAQEVDSEIAAQVSKVLTKSRADNQKLVQIIKGALNVADKNPDL